MFIWLCIQSTKIYVTYLLMFMLMGEGDTAKTSYLQKFYVTNVCVAFLQKFLDLILHQLSRQTLLYKNISIFIFIWCRKR